MNGVYNDYEVRDAYWENKTGPLTTFIGNQIVVWGQSLAFRVGDVINPQDTCWAFGFANLEQSRIPQWMIHPILNLPEWGPLTSNFLELVVQPGFQPTWGGEQQDGGFYSIFKDQGIKAGRVAPCLPGASRGPAGRFDVGYSTQPVFGADWITSPIGPYSDSGVQLAGPCDTNGPCAPGGNMAVPYGSREFFICAPFSGATLTLAGNGLSYTYSPSPGASTYTYSATTGQLTLPHFSQRCSRSSLLSHQAQNSS